MTYVLKYHVFCEAGQSERDVLALADEYRLALFESHLSEHRQTIDFRNDQFPELYKNMRSLEFCKAKIYETEKKIKQHHSNVRDRNAVTDEQREELELLRDRRKLLKDKVQEQKKEWYLFQRQFRLALQSAADWKNVKTLERRVYVLESIDWYELLPQGREASERKASSEEDQEKRERLLQQHEATWGQEFGVELFEVFARIVVERDLERRRLSREYQERGLHSSIRGEVDQSTKPKLSKNGEGTRYQYGHNNKPRPWSKLSLQFPGGLLIAEAFAGQNRQLEMDRRGRIVQVQQQIGNSVHSQVIQYRFKVPKSGPELPMNAKVQRMALVVNQEPDDTPDGQWARYIVLTIDSPAPEKHNGKAVLQCKFRWTMRKAGVEVAEFSSGKCHERLIVPRSLVDQRLFNSLEQSLCDNEANSYLKKRLGIDPAEIKPSGVEGLANYVHQNPDDKAADNLLLFFRRRLRKAWRHQRAAVRQIEHLYFNVAKRLASCHGLLLIEDIDIAGLKRYDTRDLLREDVLPPKSREILQAVSPGKLKAILKRAIPASGDMQEEPPPPLADGQTTDIFTTYVKRNYKGTCYDIYETTDILQHSKLEV